MKKKIDRVLEILRWVRREIDFKDNIFIRGPCIRTVLSKSIRLFIFMKLMKLKANIKNSLKKNPSDISDRRSSLSVQLFADNISPVPSSVSHVWFYRRHVFFLIFLNVTIH